MAERKCSDRLRELIIRYVIDSVPHGISSWARGFALIVCLFLWNFMNLANSITRKLCVTKRFLDGWRYSNYTHLVLVMNNPRASRVCYYFKTEELGKGFQGVGSLMDVSSCLKMCKLWFEQKEHFKSTFLFQNDVPKQGSKSLGQSWEHILISMGMRKMFGMFGNLNVVRTCFYKTVN